jgi:UDP-glucose 4-epimerase
MLLSPKKCPHNKTFTEHVNYHSHSIADVDAFISLVDSQYIDCVINLVSTLRPASSFSDFSRELTTCIAPAFDLAQRLTIRNIRYVYFSSGGTIYGNTDQLMVAETTSCRPITYYGYSKQLFEAYIDLMHRTHGAQLSDYSPVKPLWH